MQTTNLITLSFSIVYFAASINVKYNQQMHLELRYFALEQVHLVWMTNNLHSNNEISQENSFGHLQWDYLCTGWITKGQAETLAGHHMVPGKYQRQQYQIWSSDVYQPNMTQSISEQHHQCQNKSVMFLKDKCAS